jgi:hypothetical protein
VRPKLLLPRGFKQADDLRGELGGTQAETFAEAKRLAELLLGRFLVSLADKRDAQVEIGLDDVLALLGGAREPGDRSIKCHDRRVVITAIDEVNALGDLGVTCRRPSFRQDEEGPEGVKLPRSPAELAWQASRGLVSFCWILAQIRLAGKGCFRVVATGWLW